MRSSIFVFEGPNFMPCGVRGDVTSSLNISLGFLEVKISGSQILQDRNYKLRLFVKSCERFVHVPDLETVLMTYKKDEHLWLPDSIWIDDEANVVITVHRSLSVADFAQGYLGPLSPQLANAS